MIVLNFDVKKQRIIRKNTEYLVNHTKNFLEFHFTFDEVWEGLTKYIIFKYNEKNYLNILTYDNESEKYVIMVPSNVLKGQMFRFTIYSTFLIAGSEERITTQEVTIKLHDSGFTTNFSSVSGEDDVDIFTTLTDNLHTKFDDIIVDDENIICKSEGTIIKVIPLSVFLSGYYDKIETDNLLENKADTIHAHLTNDVNDFEDKVGLDLDSLLDRLTETIRTI